MSEMISIPTTELRTGMYVVLPSGWMNHPFLRNQFLIKTREELIKLKSCDLETVKIIPVRSTLPDGWRPPGKTPQVAPGEESTSEDKPAWNPDTLVPDGLREALHDDKMPPESRSVAVYEHSRELMTRLLESPTAENLKASKTVISAITDVILTDDQTARNMLKITSHDFYTYTHSVNVGVISIMLAKALFGQSDGHDMHELGAGFFLHDLGKVTVGAEIINKPGRLDDDEMRQMRSHPVQGYLLLEQHGQLTEEARIITLQHHERADGTGYPKRLDRDQIHVYGKICCIADVFDALTAERAYKKAMTTFEALKTMKEKMAGHFDQDLFIRFINLVR